MPSRRRSRERALQVLFNWDNRKGDIWRAADDFYETLHSEEDDPSRLERDEFMEELVLGATRRGEEIDKLIVNHSSNWRIERMPSVDRNVLRLGAFELLDGKDPPAVILNEAIELSRRYGSAGSPAFVNGVLDRVRVSLVPATN